MVVGVAEIRTERNRIAKPCANICSLERVGICIVHTGSVRVELIAENVVIENSARSCQRSMAAGGFEISTVSAQEQFGGSRAAGASPNLDDARHCIRSIQCALRTANELHTITLRKRESSEIERAAGFVDGDAIDDYLVVVRFAAAHE